MTDSEKHVYEYNFDLEGESAPACVIRMVGQNKRVLEIGAGPGSITKHIASSKNGNVVAIERDESAISKLHNVCDEVIQADLNDPRWPFLLGDKRFDHVIAADVLEHVFDPWNTLSQMASLLNSQGSVIVSLPHVGHSAVVACLLNEDFSYQKTGLLDKTHIRFFGIKNIQSLFNTQGLNIIDAQFVVVRPEETELASQWKKLPSVVKKAISTSKYGHVYQVVIKAAPSRDGSKNLDLMGLTIKKAKRSGYRRLSSVARKIIPERYHDKAKRIAYKCGLKNQ